MHQRKNCEHVAESEDVLIQNRKIQITLPQSNDVSIKNDNGNEK